LNEEKNKIIGKINKNINMAETKEKKNTPHLILLDIDGTSTNPDFATLNPRLKKVLQELITKKNHLVCFLTGRNWLSALYF